MHASDCPTVDTTEFLLAALEQASEAVVIIDGDLRISHFNAVGGIDLGRRPARIFSASMQAVSRLPIFGRARRSPSGATTAAGSGLSYRCRVSRSGASQLHGLRS